MNTIDSPAERVATTVSRVNLGGGEEMKIYEIIDDVDVGDEEGKSRRVFKDLYLSRYTTTIE